MRSSFALAALLFFLAGCGSGGDRLAQSAEHVASWGATTRFVVTEWSRGRAPAHYVADTLRAGREEIAGLEKAAESAPVSSDQRRAFSSPSRALADAMAHLIVAVDRGDQAEAMQILARTDGPIRELRRIAAAEK